MDHRFPKTQKERSLKVEKGHEGWMVFGQGGKVGKSHGRAFLYLFLKFYIKINGKNFH